MINIAGVAARQPAAFNSAPRVPSTRALLPRRSIFQPKGFFSRGLHFFSPENIASQGRVRV